MRRFLVRFGADGSFLLEAGDEIDAQIKLDELCLSSVLVGEVEDRATIGWRWGDAPPVTHASIGHG